MQVNRWSVARVQFPGIAVFAIVMLLATLLHFSIFNWSHPVAWGWLAVYIASPIATVILWILNEKDYRPIVPVGPRLPPFFTPAMLAITAVNVLVGLVLFLLPSQAAQVWPWSLTPLTARVVGGWFLASAALCYMLSQQKTLVTARVGLLANILTTALLVIGVFVHRAELTGPALAIGLFVLLQSLLGVFSAFAWWYAFQQPAVKEQLGAQAPAEKADHASTSSINR